MSFETAKMHKNSGKAYNEHVAKEPNANYAQCLDLEEDPQRLAIECIVADSIGTRPRMEDANFFRKIPQGYIAGVLDGHFGNAVARFVSERFPELFPKKLETFSIRSAFIETINEIQEEISRKVFNDQGSVAVFSFIDKKNRIYTTTLGDCEANIYRFVEDRLCSIPLSCIRDWSYPKEALRAEKYLRKPVARDWVSLWGKRIFFPRSGNGVNVSRAFGDKSYRGTKDVPGIISKPKISMVQAKPGDALILTCDGLKDFLMEADILTLISSLQPEENIAKSLVTHAVSKMGNNGGDNVTVLAINFFIKS